MDYISGREVCGLGSQRCTPHYLIAPHLHCKCATWIQRVEWTPLPKTKKLCFIGSANYLLPSKFLIASFKRTIFLVLGYIPIHAATTFSSCIWSSQIQIDHNFNCNWRKYFFSNTPERWKNKHFQEIWQFFHLEAQIVHYFHKSVRRFANYLCQPAARSTHTHVKSGCDRLCALVAFFKRST